MGLGAVQSGKTHALFCPKDPENGIVHMALADIFTVVDRNHNTNESTHFHIEMSYMELFNNTFANLLAPDKGKKGVVICSGKESTAGDYGDGDGDGDDEESLSQTDNTSDSKQKGVVRRPKKSSVKNLNHDFSDHDSTSSSNNNRNQNKRKLCAKGSIVSAGSQLDSCNDSDGDSVNDLRGLTSESHINDKIEIHECEILGLFMSGNVKTPVASLKEAKENIALGNKMRGVRVKHSKNSPISSDRSVEC